MVTLEGTREALVQSNGQGAGVAGLSIVSKWEVAGGEVGGGRGGADQGLLGHSGGFQM